MGSQDEERGRKDLVDWKEGDVYLVPSNGGKAVAWIHSSSKSTTNTNDPPEPESTMVTSNDCVTPNSTGTTSGHALLYICKIPNECVSNHESRKLDDEEDPSGSWDQVIQNTCESELHSVNFEDTNGMRYTKLPQEKSHLIVQALSGL